MSRRTLIVLSVVALALFAYIGLVDRHTLSSGELSGREARLLPRLVRARVEAIDLTHGDAHLRIVRERQEEGELGEWRLTQPTQARADQEAVASLLGSLDWADARRRLGHAGDEERGTWGLDRPRAVLELTVADETVTLALGGDAPTGEGVYALLGDGDAAIVGRDLLEALTPEAGHFRDKELFAESLSETPSSLEILRPAEDPSVHLSFTRAHGVMVGADGLLVSPSRVLELSHALSGLRARRFVQGAEGVGEATLEVRLVQGEPAGDHRLRVGGACPGQEAERLARVDDGPVVCVASSDLDAFERPPEAYRQARVVTVSDEDLRRIRVARGGRSLTVTRSGESYRYEVGDGEQGDADAEAVREWLGALRALRPAELLPVAQADLASYGVAAGGDELLLEGADGEERILLGDVTPDGQWVRRGDELAVVKLSSEDAARLSLSALDLRSRRLIRERESAVAALVIVREGAEERLGREDGQWRVQAPVELPADGARVSGLARRLARLDALRFVPAAADQGLERPALSVTVTFEGAPSSDDGEDAPVQQPGQDEDTGPRVHRLFFGARTEDGVYARLDDDGDVFVLPAALADELGQPLVSRDLLRTSPSEIAALKIERSDGAVELSYDGMVWRAGDGAADAERTDGLLEAIHDLRATRVERYLDARVAGPATLAPGALRLTVTRAEGAAEPHRYVVEIAAADDADGDRRALRADLPVELRVPAGPIATIDSYRP